LSAETVEVLSNVAKFFEEHPETLKAFRKSCKSRK
jgi:hypothetical protein